VVLASQIVLALQTIRSREISPREPAVLSIGSIHGGSKHNIIPDEVRLQLTLRTVTSETRTKMLEAITRITRGLATAAGLPENLLPEVRLASSGIPALHNDPAITSRLEHAFTRLLGRERVLAQKPIMASEDFSRFGLTSHQIPLCLFWIGATAPARLAEGASEKTPVPGLHSPLYSPDAETALPVGVSTLSAAVLEYLKR
jgi:hippurate hydrolase